MPPWPPSESAASGFRRPCWRRRPSRHRRRSETAVSAVMGCAFATLMSLSHLNVGDRLGDVLQHPAFTGHARLLLPWDDRPYDEDLPLTRIGSLLPYHSQVDPQVVVDG